MIVQIFINKDTGKIQGWGTGSGYQTSQNCETRMVPMIDEDVRKVETGEYEIILENGEFLVREKQIYKNIRDALERKKILKKKLDDGVVTSEDIQEILKLLL